MYATGLGPIDLPLFDGDIPRGALARQTTTPTVLIGAVPARAFLGNVPGLVGVNQLNVVVPNAVTAGPRVALKVQVDGVASSDQVTIAVE